MIKGEISLIIYISIYIFHIFSRKNNMASVAMSLMEDCIYTVMEAI